MMLEATILIFVSMLISFYLCTFLQTQNRTPHFLQIVEGETGKTTKNVLDLNNHKRLVEGSLASTGSTSINKKITVGKNCFRLHWKKVIHLHMYSKHNRNLSRVKSNSLSNMRNGYCNRFVTIGRAAGRMGNQMFEIASILGVAYLYDIIPIIPHTFPLKQYIDLPNRYDIGSRGLENVVHCYCRRAAVFYTCKNALKSTANVTMHGYLQSWKYFYNIKHIIRKVFTMKSKHIMQAREFFTSVTTYGYQHVCIHVRRGDFISQGYRGYTTANVSFIERAKRFYMNKYLKVDFVLTTDDKMWCRDNVKGIAISPFKSAADDMAIMILSDHVIVTSGTFGWWGAWLSGGTTVYFKGYPGHGLLSKFNRYDYYPPNWIGL